MHWRKPFPPRSVRPTPFAELLTLLVASLRPHETTTPVAAKTDEAAVPPEALTAD